MDYYSYFKERFAWESNPYTALFDCQQVIAELIDNPKIPFYFSASATVGLLAALTDQAGNGYAVTTTFQNIMKLMNDVCQRMQRAVQAADRAWLLEAQEREADGIPLYDPGEYEVWPPDLDTGEEESEPDGEEPSELDSADLFELYGNNGSPSTTGTRRPFPDWVHCADWTSGDWVQFSVHKEKILAVAAMHDFSTINVVTNAIAAASAHVSLLPVSRQAEVTLWCQELLGELYCGMKNSLQELCARSPYTLADQDVQKASLEGKGNNGVCCSHE